MENNNIHKNKSSQSNKKQFARVRILNRYRVIHKPHHPKAMQSENWKGFVYEHIAIAEKMLGRSLTDAEVVHHLNGNRADNRQGNLLVLESGQHAKLHMWIANGAPGIERFRQNGVKSRKSKAAEPKYCEVCDLTLQAKQKRFCSPECKSTAARTSWPSEEQLTKDLKRLSREAIGRKYGVSGNAVKKWAKQYAAKTILSQATGTPCGRCRD